MDGMIITAAVVLAVVAIMEIMLIFFSIPTKNAPAYVTVLPVFGEDELFQGRLEALAVKCGGRSNIILVDYSADAAQRELCLQFVHNNPDAVFISCSELKNCLSERFADDSS